jgi:antitoxin component of MazEF toxin-antitoxin module
MKPKEVYRRKIRQRGGSREIIIPKPLFHELALGRRNIINIWLSQKWSIEISDARKPINHINGIVLNSRIYRHTNSYALRIPQDALETLEAQLGQVDDIEIFKNEHGNIEFKPKI